MSGNDCPMSAMGCCDASWHRRKSTAKGGVRCQAGGKLASIGSVEPAADFEASLLSTDRHMAATCRQPRTSVSRQGTLPKSTIPSAQSGFLPQKMKRVLLKKYRPESLNSLSSSYQDEADSASMPP
jgi:hypothetical protein